jgi:hypothetical protein
MWDIYLRKQYWSLKMAKLTWPSRRAGVSHLCWSRKLAAGNKTFHRLLYNYPPLRLIVLSLLVLDS